MNKELFIKKIKWLRLIRTPGIGPVKFWKLLRHFDDLDKAIGSLSNPISQKLVEDEWENHKKKSIHLIASFENEFPQNLKKLADCPPLISVRGNLSLLRNNNLAIVGARNASFGGKKLSYEFAQELGKTGFSIVSGLARGVDESAHQGSLSSGTIAVLAGGVDYIYPPEHEKLYNEIAASGAIISEMPLGTAPAAPLFPKRNRLIAALSQGVIVIEAAKNSGSLITAQCALELGIDVFSVPGSPLDPRCLGSNSLLKQGATLVESATDVLDSLGYQHQVLVKDPVSTNPSLFEENPKNTLPDLKKRLLDDLSQTPISIEELMQTYECPSPQLLSTLFELELEGWVQRHPGSLISLFPPKK